MPRQVLTPVVAGTDYPARELVARWALLYLQPQRQPAVFGCDPKPGLPWSGEISLAADPRASTAWLPDGRLLVIRAQGDLVLQEPCGAGVPVSGGQAGRFSQIMAADPGSGNVLLKAEEGFWILDGAGAGIGASGELPHPTRTSCTGTMQPGFQAEVAWQSPASTGVRAARAARCSSSMDRPARSSSACRWSTPMTSVPRASNGWVKTSCC